MCVCVCVCVCVCNFYSLSQLLYINNVCKMKKNIRKQTQDRHYSIYYIVKCANLTDF